MYIASVTEDHRGVKKGFKISWFFFFVDFFNKSAFKTKTFHLLVEKNFGKKEAAGSTL